VYGWRGRAAARKGLINARISYHRGEKTSTEKALRREGEFAIMHFAAEGGGSVAPLADKRRGGASSLGARQKISPGVAQLAARQLWERVTPPALGRNPKSPEALKTL